MSSCVTLMAYNILQHGDLTLDVTSTSGSIYWLQNGHFTLDDNSSSSTQTTGKELCQHLKEKERGYIENIWQKEDGKSTELRVDGDKIAELRADKRMTKPCILQGSEMARP